MADSNSIPLFDVAAWLSAAGVFTLAYLFGGLACFRLRFARRFDAVLIRLTAGLALSPVFVLLSGQIQGVLLLRPYWMAFALGGVALLAFQLSRSDPHPDAESETPNRPAEPTRIPAGTVLAAIPFAVWMMYLLGPLSCPPLNYDVLEYHLGVVPHFFELGRIDPIPHVFYSAQPIATEMLYTLASVLEGSSRGGATGYVQWGMTGLAGLLLFRALERAGVPRPAALLVPFGFLTHPIMLRTELDRMTDLTGAVMLLGGWLVWLNVARGEDDNRGRRASLVILGVLAGGAVTSKWTNAGTAAWGIAMAPAAGILMFRDGDTRLPFAFWFKAAGLFILGGAAVVLPWMLWVWVETGNPIAPFGAGAFPTERWGPENLEYLLGTHGALSPLSGEYWDRLVSRILSPRIGLWPLFLGAALALAARLRLRRALDDKYFLILRHEPRNLLLSGALTVVVALLLWGRLRHAADRFLAPVIAMEFLMLGAAFAMLLENAAPKWTRAASAGAFLLFLGLAAVSPLPPLAGAAVYWDRALGRTSAEEFLQSGLGATADFFDAANELAEGSRLMAVGEARRYAFRHPVTLASVFDRHPIAHHVESAENAEGIRTSLREAGYTHLAVNEHETARLLDFHPPPILEADPAFVEVREAKNYAALVRRFPGFSEFGALPLKESGRERYVKFLGQMRADATYVNAAPEGAPAFWIAPL